MEKYKRKEIELAKPVKRVAGCKGSRGLATGYNMVEVESLNKSLTPNEGKRSSISGSVVKPEVIAKINTEESKSEIKPKFKEVESDCGEILINENIGGFAIALTHGSILFEVN